MEENFLHFSQCLERWYASHARSFPWRDSTNPYHIWISEIMSHQTQIERVAEHYYPQFLAKFPNVEDLAKSSWEEVYPVWKGLGFYRRGQNMLRCAQIICQEHGGEFPRSLELLEKLPGVGKYTAAAILSFAWDDKVPAIDTNISKIITVLWPRRNVIRTAQSLISQSSSGRNWNSAMMDLSSLLRAGKLVEGELGEKYFPAEMAQKFLPVRKAKPKRTNRPKKLIEVGIACIWQNGKYLIQTRPKGKTFPGYWEFPGGKREKGEDFRACVQREVKEEIGVEISVRPHFYEEMCRFDKTHLLLRFHRCQIQSGEPQALEKQRLQWVAPNEFDTIKFLATNSGALDKLKTIRV